MKHWTLADLWNEAFDFSEPPIKPREHLYASELGVSYIETYYKLKGVPYTNTFTAGARRKMEAGKLFEAIIRFVLKRAGILKRHQEKVDHQIKGFLPVHGRLDFIAGGSVDIRQATEFSSLIKILFDELEFPSIYLKIAEKLVEHLKSTKGGKVMHTYILETKSVSAFVYELIEKAMRPMNFHWVQNYHYLLGKDMPLGKVIYINRDDVRIMEKMVYNDKDAYQAYSGWVGQMSDYWRSQQVPPKEPLILWWDDTCNFGKNTMGVEWCKYLAMIYGYKTTAEFREYITPIVQRFNRVMLRCVNCAKLTDDNHLVIAEAKKLFPQWDNMVDLAKLRRVKLAEVEAIGGFGK